MKIILKDKIEQLFKKVITLILLIIFILLPVIQNYSNPTPYDKYYFFTIVMLSAIIFFTGRTFATGSLYLPNSPLFYLACAFFGSIILTTAFSEFSPFLLLKAFTNLNYLFFLYLIISYYKITDFFLSLKPLFYITLVLCLLGLIQFFDISIFHSFQTPADSKIQSTFSHRLFFAGYLVAIVPYLYTFVLFLKPRWQRYLSGAGILFILIILFLSLCRGAIFSFLISTLFFLFFYYNLQTEKKIKRYLKIFSITGGILLLLAVVFFFIIKFNLIHHMESDRLLSKESNSVTERLILYKTSLSMILDRPLTGFGFNSFYQAFLPYKSPELIKVTEADFFNAHSEFLEIAVENGIPVLLLFLIFLTILIVKGTRTITKIGYEKGIFLTAFISSLLAILVDNLFSFTLRYVTDQVYFWFACGMIIKFLISFENSKRSGTYLKKSTPIKICVAGFATLFITSFCAESLANLYSSKALELFDQKEFSEAETAMKKSLLFSPFNFKYYFNLAMIQGEYGNLDEAILTLNKAHLINKNYSDAYHVLVKLHLMKKDIKKALGKACELYSIDPYYNRYIDIWKEYTCTNQFCLDSIYNAIHKHADSCNSKLFHYINLAKYYEYRNNFKEAAFYLEKGATNLEAPKEYLYEMGQVYLKLEDFNKALKALSALNRKGIYKDSLLLLSEALFRTGFPKSAFLPLDTFITDNPDNFAAKLLLAEIHLNQGGVQKAKNLINSVTSKAFLLDQKEFTFFKKLVVKLSQSPQEKGISVSQ